MKRRPGGTNVAVVGRCPLEKVHCFFKTSAQSLLWLLSYLDKDFAGNIWSRYLIQSTCGHQTPGEDWYRFEIDLEFRLRMSMNMNPTCPTGSTYHRLSNENRQFKPLCATIVQIKN